MFDFYHITVVFISFGAAFFSGLLGIGGGVVIFPAFLYLIPLLGFKTFSVNEITGIAATQSLAGMFFAFLNHKKHGNIDINLVKKVLPIGLIGGLTGAVSAKFISEKSLLIIYLFLLMLAIVLILIPKAECSYEGECKFKKPAFVNFLILLGTTISGSLGFAGAFTFIPILNHFCNAPLKIAISSTTLIVFIITILVFAGKFAIGLVPFELILFIIIGSIFGANLGARLNKILSSSALRAILLFVIVFIGIRIFFTVMEY